MCSFKHIPKHPQQRLTERVLESACLMVEHVTHSACSRDLMFIYCIEQRQLPKCISPVGARASSDTVPVPAVLSPQHAKTLGFHLYLKLKIFLSTTELLFDTPYFRSEITLDLHRNSSCQFSSSSFSTVPSFSPSCLDQGLGKFLSFNFSISFREESF